MKGLSECHDGECNAQDGTQLIGPRSEGAARPLSVAAECVAKWELNPSLDFPSYENGDAKALLSLDETQPGIGYRLYTHTNYRPCDVRRRGMARVCDILLNGLQTETAEGCAQLCTCLRGISGVDCNAATWVWNDPRREPNNCFPKFIEGVHRDGSLPDDACFQRNEAEHYSLLVLTDESAGAEAAPKPARVESSGSNEGFCVDVFLPEPSKGINRTALVAATSAAVTAALGACLAVCVAVCIRRKRRRSQHKPSSANTARPQPEPDMSEGTPLQSANHCAGARKLAEDTPKALQQQGTAMPAGSTPSAASAALQDRSTRSTEDVETFTMPALPFATMVRDLQGAHPVATEQAAKLAEAAPQFAPLQRIVPDGSGATAGSLLMSDLTADKALTISQAPGRQNLSNVLTDMAAAEPPQLFLGRWQLQAEQRHGGQAVVQYARDKYGLQAIKFYLDSRDFDLELKQFRDPVLQGVLPPMLHASSNADGEACSARGFKFPPFLILERGMPLAEWTKQQRRAMEVCFMVEALADLLTQLHRNNMVHRDLKPDNVLCMTASMQWRLLDMGIVAASGTKCLPSCTLPYAPPEVVIAAFEGQQITVHPSHDIWAIGVMGYEALTQSCALTYQSSVLKCALGMDLYPWEAPAAAQNAQWAQSRLRDILEACLSRVAVQRPSAQAVLQAVSRLGQNTAVAERTTTPQGISNSAPGYVPTFGAFGAAADGPHAASVAS